MAFDVILQRNNSEPIAVTKDITDIATVSGTLKDSTSILDPTFLLEVSLTTLIDANYLTVSTFGRSYFILDIVSISNSLVEVSCHVDVLSSFADEIKANTGIVFRQENSWNLYLNDGVLEAYQNPIVTTHEFPTGFSGQTYVLALGGRYNGGVIPGGGGSDLGTKTLNGLAAYAQDKLGCPYWWGGYGRTADQSLYDEYLYVYPSVYSSAAYANYTNDFGKQVFDCVGLIKAYRWCSTMRGSPVYNAAQDVAVEGLWGQCSSIRGRVGDQRWESQSIYKNWPGICLFMQDLGHVGVSMGNGYSVEARGRSYGVVQTDIASRGWYYYGIPDWLMSTTRDEE